MLPKRKNGLFYFDNYNNGVGNRSTWLFVGCIANVTIIMDICTFNPKTFWEYLQSREKCVNIIYI